MAPTTGRCAATSPNSSPTGASSSGRRAYWYPILYGIVLNKRPQKVGKAYESIWNTDLDESYLRTYTRSQSDKLGARI